jgi:hypothetical protein
VQPLPGDFLENNLLSAVRARDLPRNVFPCPP